MSWLQIELLLAVSWTYELESGALQFVARLSGLSLGPARRTGRMQILAPDWDATNTQGLAAWREIQVPVPTDMLDQLAGFLRTLCSASRAPDIRVQSTAATAFDTAWLCAQLDSQSVSLPLGPSGPLMGSDAASVTELLRTLSRIPGISHDHREGFLRVIDERPET